MPATQRMRDYAIIIAVALEVPFPDFEDYSETSQFISQNEEAFKKLSYEVRRQKKQEANMYLYAVKDLESSKLKLKTGNWVSRRFEHRNPPYDSLESLNSADRLEMAREF
ncbi:MAG: hypothetical protein LUE24_13380 [Lachnospiraceae bacterium]|nr:hypothetical protein [Lachnospiraceae bacterium]